MTETKDETTGYVCKHAVLPLKWDKVMRKACKDHVRDTGKEGLIGHKGSEG